MAFLFSELPAHDILAPGEDGFSPCLGGGKEPGPLERKGLLWYPFLNWVGCARLVLMPAKGGKRMDDFRKDDDLEKGYFPEGTVHQDVFFDLGELHFVWDKAKSDKCYSERGFDFQTAAMVFNDGDGIFRRDKKHSIVEQRMYGIGTPTALEEEENAYIGEVNSVLYVVYTDRAVTFDDEDEDNLNPDLIYHRIISARPATRKEKKLYDDRKAIMYGSF